MKKKKGIVPIISQFIIVLALYIVFYNSIESKPNHAGFWFILVLGISFGVAICRIIELRKNKEIS